VRLMSLCSSSLLIVSYILSVIAILWIALLLYHRTIWMNYKRREMMLFGTRFVTNYRIMNSLFTRGYWIHFLLTRLRIELLSIAYQIRHGICHGVKQAPDTEVVRMEDISYYMSLNAMDKQNFEKNIPTVKLLDFAKNEGRPLVICFGSYSDPFFRYFSSSFCNLYSHWKTYADFIICYTREAFARDEWELQNNVQYLQPATLLERFSIAKDFISQEGIIVPVVIDLMNDNSCIAYSSYPARFCIIENGIIKMKGEKIPIGDYSIYPIEKWLTERFLSSIS
jgi:hypothetical protein